MISNYLKPAATLLIFAVLVSTSNLFAQDKLKKMPGYTQYSEMAPKIRSSVKSGQLSVKWDDNGTAFQYSKDGKLYRYDVNKGKTSEIERPASPPRTKRKSRPARGRQYASTLSPDEKLKAFTKNRNFYISDADGANITAITTEGNDENQIKYGIATWVYGEELGQNTAMWWSPDNKKVAFYRFDEKNAKKYYVLYDQTKVQDSVEIEAYPKVGAKNLPVDLLVYDLETKKTITIDTRDGKPYNDGALGTYLYGMDWSSDSEELFYHSTNRKQDIMEYKAANATSGESRVIVREEWPESFTKNTPDIQKVDEKNGYVYYMARSGDNHMKMQLHRVKLNGTKDTRLTNPTLHHAVKISPNNKYFVDVAQSHNIPPITNLVSMKGKTYAELATSDLSEFDALGLKKIELFTFTSADGVTELHGMIHFPSNFDSTKKYPVLLSIYGGPSTTYIKETFSAPNSLTEYGFLVVNIDGRNVKGRGKRMLDKTYGKLGMVEMDDFAEGIKSLHSRPYFDKDRVGVFGTSYGGTTSAMSLLRFPDVYHAAVANSAVTDWRNYDNIYTERFMNLLENNLEGYDNGSVMKYAKNLEGELMIFFGTNDNNVHPSNSLQLIQALQRAGKSFEVQIGPDKGHTAVNRDRMMEFFIKNLVIE